MLVRSFLIVTSLLAACSSSYTHMHMSTDSAVLEAGNTQSTYVAWYHEGQLLGAEGATHPDFPYADYVNGFDRPIEDHPSLPKWRAMLQRLRATQLTEASASEILDCTVGLPFGDLVEESLSTWMSGQPDRAAVLLDRALGLEIGDAFAETLVRMATAEPAQLTDERLVNWLRALTEDDHEAAALLVVQCDAVGPQTAREAIAELDEWRSSVAAILFKHAAPHLAEDAASAPALVQAVEELSSRDATIALRELLQVSGSKALAREVLRELDERRSGDRLALFTQCAELTIADPRAHYAIAAAIEELRYNERLAAAKNIVEHPAAPCELVLLLIDRTDELPARDQGKFLETVLDGSYGDDARIRDACRHTAIRELTKPARDRILTRLGG